MTKEQELRERLLESRQHMAGLMGLAKAFFTLNPHCDFKSSRKILEDAELFMDDTIHLALGINKTYEPRLDREDPEEELGNNGEPLPSTNYIDMERDIVE